EQREPAGLESLGRREAEQLFVGGLQRQVGRLIEERLDALHGKLFVFAFHLAFVDQGGARQRQDQRRRREVFGMIEDRGGAGFVVILDEKERGGERRIVARQLLGDPRRVARGQRVKQLLFVAQVKAQGSQVGFLIPISFSDEL